MGSTQFHPVGLGNTALSAAAPAGFVVPAQNASLVATVSSSSLQLEDLTVGKNLQQITTIFLGGVAPAGGVPITLTSNNPSLLQLAEGSTAAGATSITITIPAGQGLAYFYVRALSHSGTATFTAAAPGYVPRTATATLAPSGVVVQGNFGPVQYVFMAGDFSPMTVRVAQLDPATHAYVREQELAGGLSVQVSLTVDDPPVGTITTPVTILGGTDRVAAPFTPLQIGTTFVRVAAPPGYTEPSDKTAVTVQVM
jgi:hypothetical protein